MLQPRTIRFDWLCGVVIAAVGVACTPGITHAVSLSGTVQYTGTQGPVSSTRPILMFLWTTPSPTGNPVMQIAVSANGPFDLEVAAAGTYYLGYLLDLNDDGRASVGESFQVFHNRLNFPGDPIMVPQAGVTLSFDDTAALSGIAGTVTYTGTRGPVSDQRRLIVQGFRDVALTDETTDSQHQKANGSRYDLLTLDTNTYYMRAFLDVNGNRQFDSGEPFTVYNDRGTPPFDPVVAGPHQTAIDVTFGDENLSGMPTPSPTPARGSCVGDCNGDGQVTVNELIEMVNIALGSAAVSTCTAGDANGDGEITVNEIVAGVNNALNGCVGSSPTLSATFGTVITFATHTELAGDGFSFGPSDGALGAIPAGGTNYTFYGTAGSTSACAGTPKANGAFTFTGTLDHVTGSNGCTRLFGPGDGPAGWAFAKDYAGGGQVVRFASGGTSGWLMPFHGEFHWQNLANPPSYKCTVGTSASLVPCFYSSVGLAVSTDDGKTFDVAGQILQPSQPLSVFQGSGRNMDVGYGSLVVADANGTHLDNPPADPSGAYFYLFFADRLPGLPGLCATNNCMGVARAPYADVVAAALSGDPHRVAQVFHKYDGASPNPWTQSATAFVQGSATPDLSGTAGQFAPLWTDEAAFEPVVLYDSSFDVYLAVYPYGGGAKVRASSDLIHWSEPIGPLYQETNRTLFYPTLIGETGDPTIGGPAPRVYFSSFPTGKFPDYTTAVFESVPFQLALTP